ncbi:MAG: ribbon-helix-helix protein, CopG family [Candidatus Korobacteraceae bacterium]
MKEKTSITLSSDILVQVDRLAGSKHSRSAIIERVLRKYLQERTRAALNARDLALLNENAEQFSAEALDVLEYQAPSD